MELHRGPGCYAFLNMGQEQVWDLLTARFAPLSQEDTVYEANGSFLYGIGPVH